ncbi:hypothetical protein U9M48_033208 [Paspalum notatum var. saurae]|uniref:Uncharacterized protein n=1 Tax=Paspalum notatum var. saurae TaxID=547442 RepID=A0AAQ3X5B3_PASNO
MALRSIVVKMKAIPIPHEVPGFGAFVAALKPKPKPKSNIAAAIGDKSRFPTAKDLSRGIDSLIEKELKPIQEARQKKLWGYRGVTLLLYGSASAAYWSLQ